LLTIDGVAPHEAAYDAKAAFDRGGEHADDLVREAFAPAMLVSNLRVIVRPIALGLRPSNGRCSSQVGGKRWTGSTNDHYATNP